MSKPDKLEIEARISLNYTQDVPTFYVNHAEMAPGIHECSVWFARIAARPSNDEMDEIKATGEITVEPEVQLLIPFSLLPGLIQALQTTQTIIEERKPQEVTDAGS